MYKIVDKSKHLTLLCYYALSVHQSRHWKKKMRPDNLKTRFAMNEITGLSQNIMRLVPGIKVDEAEIS